MIFEHLLEPLDLAFGFARMLYSPQRTKRPQAVERAGPWGRRYRMNRARRMMIGIGTPISQSRGWINVVADSVLRTSGGL